MIMKGRVLCKGAAWRIKCFIKEEYEGQNVIREKYEGQNVI